MNSNSTISFNAPISTNHQNQLINNGSNSLNMNQASIDGRVENNIVPLGNL